MRHTFAYLFLIITATFTFLPVVFLTSYNVDTFSLDPTGKTLTFTTASGPVAISLLNKDSDYLSRFLTKEVKKEFTTLVMTDLPLPVSDNYQVIAINGFTGTVGRDATDAKKMKTTSTYTAPTLTPTPHSVTAAPVMKNDKNELTFKISSGEVTLKGSIPSDFNKLAMGQTNVMVVTGLAVGLYKISDSFDNNEYYLRVVAAGTAGANILMVIHQESNLAIRNLRKLRRVFIFFGLYAIGVSLSTIILKKVDPEIYILGGGISGAIFGFDGTEEAVLEDSVMDASGSSGSEDLSNGPGRTDRSRPSSSDVTSSPTTPRTDEAAYGENEISDEFQEKADAHSASCVLLITTIAFFLL